MHREVTRSNRPGTALLAARKGIGKIPDRHPLTVTLRTQAARACGRGGRRAECVELLAEAQELHETLPATPSRRDGATVALLLAQSHLVVSTWPEYRMAIVDVTICGPKDSALRLWSGLDGVLLPLACDIHEHRTI